MDKAPDAFRTISEVADDLDIPQHVLRFWETRFTQIKPMKRSGGRRYYRPDDVDLLRGIRRLLYGEGYTIRGVQRILKENGIKSVQGLVDGHAAPSFAPTSAAIAPRVQAKRPVIEEDHEVEEDHEEEEVEAELEEEIEEEAEDETDAEDAEDEEEEGDEDDGEEAEDDEGEDEEAEEEEEDEEEAATPVAARREPPMTSSAPRVEPQLQRPRSRANPVLANPVAARPEPAMSAPVQSARPAAVPGARPNPQRRLERERLEAVLEELLSARRALDTAMKDG